MKLFLNATIVVSIILISTLTVDAQTCNSDGTQEHTVPTGGKSVPGASDQDAADWYQADIESDPGSYGVTCPQNTCDPQTGCEFKFKGWSKNKAPRNGQQDPDYPNLWHIDGGLVIKFKYRCTSCVDTTKHENAQADSASGMNSQAMCGDGLLHTTTLTMPEVVLGNPHTQPPLSMADAKMRYNAMIEAANGDIYPGTQDWGCPWSTCNWQGCSMDIDESSSMPLPDPAADSDYVAWVFPAMQYTISYSCSPCGGSRLANPNTGIVNFEEYTEASDAVQVTKVFPNPTADELNIVMDLGSNRNISVEVADLAGRTVLTNEFGVLTTGNQQLSMDVHQLPEGLYVVSIKSTEDLVATFNLKIQR